MAGKRPEEPKQMTDADVLALLVRVDERTSKMQDDVDQLKHVLLEGNGSPAMTVQVATLNTKVEKLEQDRESERQESGLNYRERLALYGTLGAAAITGLFELVKLIHG